MAEQSVEPIKPWTSVSKVAAEVFEDCGSNREVFNMADLALPRSSPRHGGRASGSTLSNPRGSMYSYMIYFDLKVLSIWDTLGPKYLTYRYWDPLGMR